MVVVVSFVGSVALYCATLICCAYTGELTQIPKKFQIPQIPRAIIAKLSIFLLRRIDIHCENKVIYLSILPFSINNKKI